MSDQRNPDAKIKITSLKDEVRTIIRGRIISNDLKPGQRIVETEIAKNLGTSQVPVREALRGLEEEGFVRSVRYKGSFVTEINELEMYRIALLRSQIETSAIELIVPNLTTGHIEKLYDIVNQMVMCDRDEYYPLNSGLDISFHSTIVKWSEINTYDRVWNMLIGHIERFIAYKQARVYRNAKKLFKDHIELIQALESGDLAKAKDAFNSHIITVFD